MKYSLYAALHEDIDAGRVWIGTRPGPDRCVVRITNTNNGYRTFCEALEIDDNFLTRYEQPPRVKIQNPVSSLVISEWYRNRLGIQKGAEADLEVKVVKGRVAKLRSCLHHPQAVVRISTWLGIISVCLGVIGFVLGVISLLGCGPYSTPTGCP